MLGSPVPVKRNVSPSPVTVPRLSASRVKSLQECSWEFYCSGCLKLPERVWSKTFVGSLCHLVLECLSKDNKVRKEYKEKIQAARTHTCIPSIVKMVDKFKRNNPLMEDKHSIDLDDLLMVALDYDFDFAGAQKILPPEFRFELEIGKTKIKGFIDRIAFYDGYAVIRDYKTQKTRFNPSDLENNIQAAIYQLAVKKIFGVPARVEFILLRHPGNKKDPQKFLQVVEPYSEAQMNGLISYLEHLYQEFESFNVDKARKNLKAFKDMGFCRNVCGFRLPFYYYAVLKDGKLVRTSKNRIEPLEGEIVSEHYYAGCPYFFTYDGKQRNFS